MLRKLLIVVVFLPSTQAWANSFCGRGDAVSGNTKVSAMLFQTDDKSIPPTYFPMVTTSEDGSTEFSVGYEFYEGGFRPAGLTIRSQYLIAEASPDTVQRLRWRVTGGAWTTSTYRLHPQRSDYPQMHASIEYRAAQWVKDKPNFTYHDDQLMLLQSGGRYEIQRQSEAGEVLSTSFLNYPSGETVNTMFGQAQRIAETQMEPCEMNTVTPPRSPLRN